MKNMFKKVDPRQNFPEMEKDILEFWKSEKVFEESMSDGGRPTFSFYDGPPFATGLPHYGHVVASLIKDAVPRYWTMKGSRVDRRWGWDCHGLPVENLIEKELGIENKQAIEKMGVDKFNEACCGSVQRYAKEWKEFIPRVGRWVDMENDYRTMDWKYTESIWWVFSEVYRKGLVYEGYKAMQLCPRCDTTLANFEVTQGYKDITDISATVRFKLRAGQKVGDFEADEHTYILAWTTTPWTLPGNVALAVGKDVEYALVKAGEAWYVLAKDKAAEIFKDQEAEISGAFGGASLVGLSYEPLFSYYAEKEDLENRENGWKIYAGDFVTTEEGVGVVHIAPAFGEDDMKLGREMKLPFVQHVTRSGHFTEFVAVLPEDDKPYFIDKDGEGREVKPKRNPRETDEKVVEYLKKTGALFASENYKHSYPHCWRCDTPLLNYAAGSWFVEVTKIKDKLVQNNQQVNWVPGYIKDGRFGKWLEDARDWAISRSRFWGAPLPIWKCDECYRTEVIGSIDELRAKADKKITKFIFARHGEAESTVKGIRSDSENEYPLVEEGKNQSEQLGEMLKDSKIDVILASPVLRASETAEIIGKKLGVPVLKENALKDYDFGSWTGFTTEELLKKEDYQKYRALPEEQLYAYPQGGDGESRADIEKRVREFIGRANEEYAGKNVLLIAHGVVGAVLHRIIDEASLEDTLRFERTVKNAAPMTYYVREDGKRFDLHKPYIDEIGFTCPECGKSMRIIGDVFDCWFESGSMPYAQIHYPFENKEKFETSYPADFIAEGIDQTRGWFYTLMVLGAALFDKPAFKNVIVNGIVLAEDGQKMSKKLKNYPDPNLILEKYGADSLRYYLFTSPVMKAENLRFSEKGVDEVLKKFVLTLWNTYSFFVMNAEIGKIEKEEIADYKQSDNLLDRWIISELNLLIAEVDKGMRDYDLVKASRPLMDFMDELSNWYVRRSRRRFTSEDAADKLAVHRTLYFVLVEFTKLMAPFMPFIADEIFRNLTDKKSVHLEKFPEADTNMIDNELSYQMKLARDVVTAGLAERAKNRIKVRMPLKSLTIRKDGDKFLYEDLIQIIKEELNVKEVIVHRDIIMKAETGTFALEGKNTDLSIGTKKSREEAVSFSVELDLKITEELELEGLAREVIRQIQAMRKEARYQRDDSVSVKYSIPQDGAKAGRMFEKWGAEIRKECLLRELVPADAIAEGESDGIAELDLGGEKITLGIKK